jgi:hypothetical protein
VAVPYPLRRVYSGAGLCRPNARILEILRTLSGVFRAALARAVELGWLRRHESGTYVKFTPAGAEMFA